MTPPALQAEALKYWPICQEVAQKLSLDPVTLMAIMWRESLFGLSLNPRGPSGTGDGGHGRGLMQIDDRFHKDWVTATDWTDPRNNITQGAKVLEGNVAFFANPRNISGKPLDAQTAKRASIAAYNAGCRRVALSINLGRDVDGSTTGKDYSAWVVAREAELRPVLS